MVWFNRLVRINKGHVRYYQPIGHRSLISPITDHHVTSGFIIDKTFTLTSSAESCLDWTVKITGEQWQIKSVFFDLLGFCALLILYCGCKLCQINRNGITNGSGRMQHVYGLVFFQTAWSMKPFAQVSSTCRSGTTGSRCRAQFRLYNWKAQRHPTSANSLEKYIDTYVHIVLHVHTEMSHFLMHVRHVLITTCTCTCIMCIVIFISIYIYISYTYVCACYTST